MSAPPMAPPSSISPLRASAPSTAPRRSRSQFAPPGQTVTTATRAAATAAASATFSSSLTPRTVHVPAVTPETLSSDKSTTSSRSSQSQSSRGHYHTASTNAPLNRPRGHSPDRYLPQHIHPQSYHHHGPPPSSHMYPPPPPPSSAGVHGRLPARRQHHSGPPPPPPQHHSSGGYPYGPRGGPPPYPSYPHAHSHSHSHPSSSYPPPPPHSAPPPPIPPPPPTSSSPQDTTSLGALTVRFVQLLHSVHPPYGSGELDLNRAMDHLGVQKRRLYDVTNVLEGIGLIEKRNKNQVAWVVPPPQSIRAEPDMESTSSTSAIPVSNKGPLGPLAAASSTPSDQALSRDIASCKAELSQLDSYIDVVHRMVQQYTSYTYTPTGTTPEKAKSRNSSHRSKSKSSHLFVTQKEISQLQNYANDTIVAIRAPSGTVLEVPDPDKGMRLGKRRFQIYLSTPKENGGTIQVDLVQHGRRRRGGGTRGKERSGSNRMDSSSSSVASSGKRDDDPSVVTQHVHKRSASQGSHSHGALPPPPRQSNFDKYPIQERRDSRRVYDRHHSQPPQASRASPTSLPPQLQIPVSLPKSSKERSSEGRRSPLSRSSFAPRKRPVEDLEGGINATSAISKKRPALSFRPQRRDCPESPPEGRELGGISRGSKEEPILSSPGMPSNRNGDKALPISRRTIVKPRRRSPTPCSLLKIEKTNSLTHKDKNGDGGSISVAEPMTPRAYQSLGAGNGLPVGASPASRRNFDLLNGPLHSPAPFYLEGSPLTACRSNNTAGLLASPFRFSPNFPFSPFPNTPSAINWDPRGRSEKENNLDLDIFSCSPIKETKMK